MLASGAGRFWNLRPALNRLVSIRLKLEDRSEDIAQETKHPIRVGPVPILAVVAVFVAATEAFAEVVLVLGEINVVTVISHAGVLIPETLLVAVSPTILTVRLAGANTFFVTISHCLPKQICRVLVCLVVSPATIVAILRRRIAVLPVLPAILILT
jgi:hypothetical protein